MNRRILVPLTVYQDDMVRRNSFQEQQLAIAAYASFRSPVLRVEFIVSNNSLRDSHRHFVATGQGGVHENFSVGCAGSGVMFGSARRVLYGQVRYRPGFLKWQHDDPFRRLMHGKAYTTLTPLDSNLSLGCDLSTGCTNDWHADR